MLREGTKKAPVLREGTKKGPKQTKTTGHEPTIYHRYGSASHSRQDVDDEGTDGLYEERP